MLSIELQILKIEGLEPGTICKVFIDNEEVTVKNYQFSILKHGTVHLEFFKGRQDLGGVFFSSELLASVAYSYVPIYFPSIYIDTLPTDIDPPRVLLIQTASSLETSMLSSKCETICFEESLESFKVSKDDSLDRSYYANKPELEYTRKAEAKLEQSVNLNSLEKKKEIYEDVKKTEEDCTDVLLNLIQGLENQRDLLLTKSESGQGASSLLMDKIMQNATQISKLVKEKNQLFLKVKSLEKENRALKNKTLQQLLVIQEISSKENLLRKEFESKKLIDSLTNRKF